MAANPRRGERETSDLGQETRKARRASRERLVLGGTQQNAQHERGLKLFSGMPMPHVKHGKGEVRRPAALRSVPSAFLPPLRVPARCPRPFVPPYFHRNVPSCAARRFRSRRNQCRALRCAQPSQCLFIAGRLRVRMALPNQRRERKQEQVCALRRSLFEAFFPRSKRGSHEKQNQCSGARRRSGSQHRIRRMGTGWGRRWGSRRSGRRSSWSWRRCCRHGCSWR